MLVLIEAIELLATFAPDIPEISTLIDTVRGIVSSGTATPEQEATVRASLDAVRAAVDAS